MTTFATNNITTWFGGYDMTTDISQTTMPLEREPLDSTTFGPVGQRRARSRKAGLEDASSQVAGFWQADEGLDEAVFDALGSAMQVITHSHDGAEGSPAYFYRAKAFSYQLFGPVGQLAPFSLTAQGAKGNGVAGVVRGAVLKTLSAVNATGATGTPVELGPVASGQHLYAALHATDPGTTVTAVLESDDADTFGSPTTRATFGPITVAGGYWATRVAGPIADTWYRLRVTALTGTASIACVAGIK
ncbi:hypothetical protein [Micromonospora sp. WMMD1082]|uniref:hypothetical protein n=1 Tax=Micromonospora sp. WMMD1082 TaxID=3016104 RepID=UPI002416FC18|nr:hypothetical protein [Micromonospora sp. WMMD1082]MDG4796214.1 hypothetical protein [Micromonospora sp. WMMD1082]